MSFWRRPRTHPARRLVFQLHVWTGLVVGAYALFIGLTGAVLVFRADLQKRAYPQFFAHRAADAPLADAAAVITELQRRFPDYRFSGIDYPSDRRGTFLTYLSNGDELRTVFSDAATGRVIGELPRDGWIQRLQDLHFNFLAGQRGYICNGIAAACLLTMCVTGVIAWWPGVGRIMQAFLLQRARNWKRVVWEVHSVAGIWTVALLVVWTISGVYFSFPGPFRGVVEHVVAVTPYRSVQSGVPRAGESPKPADLIARARARVPGAQLARFLIPAGERGAYGVVLAREQHGDADTSDEVTVYFDRYTGAELAVTDESGRTTGDLFLTWLGRLHVGNFGGLAVKIVWFAAGLVFPLLFLTGITMWWNRFVRPRRAANVIQSLGTSSGGVVPTQ